MVSLMVFVITSLTVALTVSACDCIVSFLRHLLDWLNYSVSLEKQILISLRFL